MIIILRMLGSAAVIGVLLLLRERKMHMLYILITGDMGIRWKASTVVSDAASVQSCKTRKWRYSRGPFPGPRFFVLYTLPVHEIAPNHGREIEFPRPIHEIGRFYGRELGLCRVSATHYVSKRFSISVLWKSLFVCEISWLLLSSWPSLCHLELSQTVILSLAKNLYGANVRQSWTFDLNVGLMFVATQENQH